MDATPAPKRPPDMVEVKRKTPRLPHRTASPVDEHRARPKPKPMGWSDMSDISPNARSHSISNRPHLPDATASFGVQGPVGSVVIQYCRRLGTVGLAHGCSQHGPESGLSATRIRSSLLPDAWKPLASAGGFTNPTDNPLGYLNEYVRRYNHRDSAALAVCCLESPKRPLCVTHSTFVKALGS